MDWLDDQVRRGRIEEDAARCICWEDILQFAKSGIGRRLREADGKQRLWRGAAICTGNRCQRAVSGGRRRGTDTGTGNYRCLF